MDTDQIIVENFITAHSLEALQLIEKLGYQDIADFIHEIPVSLATRVLYQMNNYKAAKCLELLKLDVSVEIIENLDLLSAELLLRQCDEAFRNSLLEKIDPEIAEKIRQKLKYTVDSVGSCMKTKVFSLQRNVPVGEAVQLMKNERELIASEIFITDKHGKVEGIVRIEHLLMADTADPIGSMLITDIPRFLDDELIQTIKSHPAWIKYRTLPVIESSEGLIGSLHFKDVRRGQVKKDKEVNKDLLETGSALGELYRIGLTGLLQSIGSSE